MRPSQQVQPVAAPTAHAIEVLNSGGGEAALRHAMSLLDQGMAQGCARAAHQLAILAAVGVLAPADWPRALQLLSQAADLGSVPARAELDLLSRMDVAAWLSPPPKRSLCESPRLRAIEGFAPAEVCDWLVARAQGRLAPAKTYSETGEARLEQGRTNTETDFTITETDLVMVMMRARISAAVGLPTAVMELTKVLHYSPGERFNRHFDYLDPNVSGHAAEISTRGQRIVTFLLYLNDDYQGGETDFPLAGIRHRGAKGDGFFFANVDPAGEPDRATLHQGLPPTEGEKWLLSQWIRNRPQ